MIERETKMEARGLADMLGETFTIYGRHFRQFVRLGAIVQVPTSLIALAPSNDLTTFVILNIVNLFAMASVFGAMIFAVGQHYVANTVDVGRCYGRVVERAVSMFALTAILSALVALGIALVDIGVPDAAGLVLFFIMAGYMLYLAIATPAVIVERYRWVGALRRGFALARRNEWRIIGNLLVFSLVAIGLTIVLFLPFLLISMGSSPDEMTMFSRAVQVVGNMVVAVAVPPVLLIATTLLYYDLRVRKEDYDIAALSREMGLAAT